MVWHTFQQPRPRGDIGFKITDMEGLTMIPRSALLRQRAVLIRTAGQL